MDIGELIGNFKAMPEWEDRYAYLVELGRALPPMAPEKKTDAARIRGCASQVWMDYNVDKEGRHHFQFDSDALIVKGLLYVVHAIFEGKTAEEIGRIEAEKAFDETGLSANLSSQRLIGLGSAVARIKGLAKRGMDSPP